MLDPLELVSKLPCEDHEAGDLEESVVDRQMMLEPEKQALEIPNPGDCAFYLPASLVSAERAAILKGRAFSATPVWGDEFGSPPLKPQAEGVRVRGAVVYQAPRLRPRGLDFFERCVDEANFCRARAREVGSQRKTLAVRHHHPLRTLAPLGLSDAGAPFFAGAKEPSARHSSQSMRPSALSVSTNDRQISSQTPASSQSRRRRQHVEGLGNSRGRSFHLAPLRRTQRIPSKHSLSGTRGLPPRGCFFGVGKWCLMRSQVSSVSSLSRRAMARTPPALRQTCHPLQHPEKSFEAASSINTDKIPRMISGITKKDSTC